MTTNPWDSDDSGNDDDQENEPDPDLSLLEVLQVGINGYSATIVENAVVDTDDIEVLKRAYTESEGENQAVVVDRLHELDASIPEGDTEQDSLGDNPEQTNTQPEDESASDANMNDSENSDVATENSIEISNIAPSAMSPAEASNREHTWRVMVWGRPSVGKSHFAYSMPEPVCIIDTEGKADDIAHKFVDKDFYLWQPDDYDDASESLDEALQILDAYREQKDQLGTIVVDSMSIMWTWAQQKYVDHAYIDDKELDDVKDDFQTGFGSGQSDWKKIKDYHNAKFRRKMLNTPYHLCWTTMAEADYEAAIEDGVDRDKPSGEKNNVYKVGHILHLHRDENGVPVGDLEKSGLIQRRFVGLESPDFASMKEVIGDIEDAEISDDEIDVDEATDYDIGVVKGTPRLL